MLAEQEGGLPMYAVIALLLLVLVFVLPIIPGKIAQNKARSFWGFYFFGFLFFFPAIIVAALLSPRAINTGDVVKVSGNVALSDGGKLPAGWVSKVIATDVIDGTYVAQIKGPSGDAHWVGRGALKQA